MTSRWLIRWGGLVLIATALITVTLPVLLPPLPKPIQLPPPPADPVAPADAEMLPVVAPVAPTPTPTGQLPPIIRKPDAPEDPVSPRLQPDTTAPIVDLRRISGRAAVPTGAEPPEPQRRVRADEFDRSSTARQRGVQRFGGTAHTESAVEAGLAWLAAHQSADGTWDRFNFADLDPPDDRCGGHAILRTEDSLRAGLTGLCLLAFLGAGYTDREGPYQQNVRAAVEALLELQKRHGGFGPGPEDGMAGYNDSLATFALAEYSAMVRDPRMVEPLQRAVGRLARSQQALGGWDYLPWPTIGRNDTSITAWVVQALHACAAAGIDVPQRTLVKAALHFSRASDTDGRVWYSDSGTGFELDANHMPKHRYGPAMTAAGLTCAQLLGWRMDGLLPRKQTAVLFSRPPTVRMARGRDRSQLHNEYYWYYGTVAMFQRGGESWERWNAKLRDAILPLQNREKTAEGKKRSACGSWDPYGKAWGKWGKMGSRVYTTAICVLTLEIYYRHTPAYLTEEVLLSPSAWREYLGRTNPRQRLRAIACLEQLRVEVGEVVLVDLLHDGDRSVARAAAEALAWLDSPLGLTLLDDIVTTLPPWGRRYTERALQRAREIAKLPPAEGRVRVFDPQQSLATIDLPRAYVGMPLSIRRQDREVARMRVVQRFTGHSVVVAELLGDPPATQPESGDVAIGP